MSGTLREHSWPMLGSVLLHAALALAVILAARVGFERKPQPSLGPSIEAVAVDAQVLRNLQHRRQEQQQAQERAAADARARQEEEQARQRAAEQERERQAAEQAQREAAERAAEQAAALKAQQATVKAQEAARQAASRAAAQEKAAAAKAQAEANARAQAAAQQQREAAAQAVADQKARALRESELRRQMADEERLSALQAGPQGASYIAAIQASITHAWIKPASARAGILCRIEVMQVPGGEVTSAHVTDCNGDEAVRQSVENAVLRASPLPEPPDPALFQRKLTLVFKPNE